MRLGISLSLQQPRRYGAPSPTAPVLSVDLTSALPGSITFARSGTRNAIVSGALVSVSSGVPAFESWDGVNRGMCIDAAAGGGDISQVFTYSNTLSDSSWTKSAVTDGTGGTGPDGVSNSLDDIAETTTNAIHFIRKRPGSIASGVRQTFYAIIAEKSGATRWGVQLRMSDEFNNNGARARFMIDGTDGYYIEPDTTRVTNPKAGVRKLANDMLLIWLTGTWVNTGNKEFTVQTLYQDNANGPYAAYAGSTSEGFQIYGAQLITGELPTGWVTTTTAAVAQPAESAVFNDISWFTSGEGTFLVEHDCVSGPLIGSDSATVLSATVAGKTAFAWDGSSSDTVNNGGSASSGAAPSFGSDIRLLGNSAAGNIGHVKALKFWPRRLSVEEMQEETAPTVVSTANPGTLRTASIDNCLPKNSKTMTGTQLNFVSRIRLKMGSTPMSSLKLVFGHFIFDDPTPGNALVIDACYLERVTTVAESVQVLFGGVADLTLADGDLNVASDAILPSSFTGLTDFPADTELWVRVRGHVASAGHLVPVMNRMNITDSVFRLYDPATYTLTNFTGTGALTFSGTGFTNPTDYGYAPILVGVPVSGDPKTVFIPGDSTIEGTNGNFGTSSGTYVRKALEALRIASIEIAKGGSSHAMLGAVTHWHPYLAYCRVLVDCMGINDSNLHLHHFKIWAAARSYNIDKILHSGFFPKTTSTDSWATEANQSVSDTRYPASGSYAVKNSALEAGLIDIDYVPAAVRGANPQKWIVDGSTFYATVDGTHASTAGDNLLAAEIEPVLDAIEVTA